MENYEKKYKEALRKATKIHRDDNEEIKHYMEVLFPELAESKDEKIRKKLIENFKWFCGDYLNTTKWGKDDMLVKDIIIWLERQGKQKEYTFKSIPRLLDMIEPSDRAKAYCQKLIDTLTKEGYNTDAKIVEGVFKGWNGEDVPMAVMDEQKPQGKSVLEAIKECSDCQFNYAGECKGSCALKRSEQIHVDKVEPKFHKGDWVVFNNKHQSIYQVEKIEDGYYILRHTHGGTFRVCVLHDKSLRLWTTQDAKDGDVLVGKINGDKYIIIFKRIKDVWVETHGHYNGTLNRFCMPSHMFCRDYQGTFTPATQEQRDLLFKRMKEAGYAWDEEKKGIEDD